MPVLFTRQSPNENASTDPSLNGNLTSERIPIFPYDDADAYITGSFTATWSLQVSPRQNGGDWVEIATGTGLSVTKLPVAMWARVVVTGHSGGAVEFSVVGRRPSNRKAASST